MAFSIVVDGNNFINDLDRRGKGKEYVLNELSFPMLHVVVQERLQQEGLYSHPFLHTEFICSDRGQIGPFSGEDRDKLLSKLRNERGVSVLQISHHTARQKGVDLTVFIRMMTLARSALQPHELVLFSSDTDFVPALRLLAEQGTHVVVVGYRRGPCELHEELVNTSYMAWDLEELLQRMEEARRAKESG